MVNKDGSFVSGEFEVKGNKYIVVSTKEGDGWSVWSCIDTIQNVKTKNTKTKTRENWKRFFDKHNSK